MTLLLSLSFVVCRVRAVPVMWRTITTSKAHWDNFSWDKLLWETSFMVSSGGIISSFL